MRYNHFSMLPEQAFQPRNGRLGMTLEGGGGGPSSSTTYTSSIPEWLRPQTEALLGAATQEYFTTKAVPGKKAVYDSEGNMISDATKPTYEITGIKPYKAYSEDMEDYVAGFSPQQQQVFGEAAGMQTPGQFGLGSQYASQAGLGGLSTAPMALGYGAQGADIGGLGLGYGGYGANIGQQAMGYGRQAAGMGGLYEQMATDPGAMQAYMSPYVRNVIETQKESAIRDAQKANLAQNLGAVRQGTYGGARQLLAQTERERNLAGQLGQIEATGLQDAYKQAQQAQQFGVTTGLQGLQGAQQGLGTALQGGQLGLSGIQQALAGQQLGLQGVQGAQAGYGMLGQAGTSLANIGTAQQTADLARMGFQADLGAQQRAREQAMIDQSIQNYAMGREYPYEQLAKYSALLRGYYTPSTTQSTYQAYNPAAQMTGLIAQGAGAYGAFGGGKKAGGSIKEKKFAEGGIASIDEKVMNDPTSYSPEMINQGINSGAISKMAGAIGLSAIENAQQQAAMQQGLQTPPPEGSVLGDLQMAAQGEGIDAMPIGVPVVNAAGGGIVAFDKGGLNDEERRRNEFYKSIGLEGYEPDYTGKQSSDLGSIADYMDIAQKYLKKPKTQEETDYEESLRKRPEKLAEQREMDRYLALMKWGSGVSRAASKSGNFLDALGAGGEEAFPAIAAGEKAYREGITGAEKELAALGAKGRAEEAELGKAGLELYGKAEQRKASTSDMKEYAENYVKMRQAMGDKRPAEVIRNEGANELLNRRAAAAIQQANVASGRLDVATETEIRKIQEGVKDAYQIVELAKKPGASEGLKKQAEIAQRRIDAATSQINRLTSGQGAAPAPARGEQITVGGRTFSKPPSMTQEQWEAYKKYAAGAK